MTNPIGHRPHIPPVSTPSKASSTTNPSSSVEQTEAAYRAGDIEIRQKLGHGTKREGVEMKLFADAAETGYPNLSDEQLERLHQELMEGTLDRYEGTEVHGFLVESIANTSLERAKRRAREGASAKSILSNAQVQLYSDYRETGAHGEPYQKLDRKSTIYRDAERLVHGAKERTDSYFDAVTTEIGNRAYNAAKGLGLDLSTSGDRPTPPGGTEWLKRGIEYGSTVEDGQLPPFEAKGAGPAVTREVERQHAADEELRASRVPDREDVHVRADDTLWAIAGRELGDPKLWPKIWAENKDTLKSGDPHLIYEGEIVTLPETSDGPPRVLSPSK